MGFYKQLSQTIYYILRSIKMIFTKKNMFFFLFIAVFIACCVFSNKVFASGSLSWEIIYGLRPDPTTSKFVSDINDNCVGYISTNSQNIYTLTNNSSLPLYFYIRRSDSIPADNVSFTFLLSLDPGFSYQFIGNSEYFYSIYSPSDSTLFDYVSVTYKPINSYDNTIDNLTQAISLDNLWAQFGVCLIALAVLFAIGFFVVRKVLKKDTNYKG